MEHQSTIRARALPVPPAKRLKELEAFFLPQGSWVVLPASAYNAVTQEELSYLCHKHAIYGIVTTELVQWLGEQLGGCRAIEIGAGAAGLGRAVGIPMTDADIQSRPDVALYYRLCRQPTIKLPPDVHRLDARQAVRRYRPHTVVGSWVTQRGTSGDASMYGIDEARLLDRVRRYIVIGHEHVHGQKRILARPHRVYKFPWLKSRASDQSKNCIYVWER